jgi:hypothetical protein
MVASSSAVHARPIRVPARRLPITASESFASELQILRAGPPCPALEAG